ncbi:MAG: DNA primase [Aquificaceae bacterium]|nr:DNA primase [Aquificaceae bacterium]
MPTTKDQLGKIDIVEVISSYIELKRVGNNFVARCPFHPDDTPSFYVSPSRGIFKCFGCGVGGDAVKFVSLYENIDYLEALEKLAKRYNIPIKLKKKEKNSKLLLALQRVTEFYRQELRENPQALVYLQNRGLNSSTINKFQLGFGGDTEKLVKLLKEEGLLEVYERSGNLVNVEGEFYRDLFRKRLVIPIRDMSGDVVAFGGRSLEEGHPKYVNSPESEVFRKRSGLFGLHEAKDYIREKEEVILVEGYFDLLSLWQEGIRNCTAPLGTALTEEQALLLSKLTKRAVLLYDGDRAGRKAVRSSLPYLLRTGMKVRVVYLPEGEDPDSFVRKEPETLKNLLLSAKEVEVDYLERIREGNKEAFEDLLYFCSFIPDSVKRYELLKELSRITGLPLTSLQERTVKVEGTKKANSFSLGYQEAVLLAGLYRFGFEGVELEGLKLSPQAIELVEALRKEEYHLLPDYIKNFRAYDLQRAFQESLHLLRLPEMEDPEDFQKARERSKAQPRKLRMKR